MFGPSNFPMPASGIRCKPLQFLLLLPKASGGIPAVSDCIFELAQFFGRIGVSPIGFLESGAFFAQQHFLLPLIDGFRGFSSI